MKSSTSGFARGGLATFVIAAFLVAACAAQQTTNPPQEQSVPPAELPAAQPISQAARSASEAATSGPKADEPIKLADQPDQSAMVKLGPGDLIEVNVYNVPELASKVRVSNSGDVYLPLIDYVHVDGLTLEEAQTLIQKRLEDGGFVRSPHVDRKS